MDPISSIPDPGIESQDIKHVPSTAPEISQVEEYPEVIPYKISFAQYKKEECEIDSMTSDNAKATLKILRDMGVYFTDEKNFSANSDRIEIIHIGRDGKYNKLYRGLEEDIDIREVKYIHERKNADIRLFFFELGKERTIFIIAARQSHYDTSKGKFKKYGK